MKTSSLLILKSNNHHRAVEKQRPFRDNTLGGLNSGIHTPAGDYKVRIKVLILNTDYRKQSCDYCGIMFSVIVIIQANYNHCNEIAIAILGGIYAISACWYSASP